MSAFRSFCYFIVLIIGVAFSNAWIGVYNARENVVDIVYSLQDRPHVYRVLMPLIARFFTSVFSIPPDYSIAIVVVLSSLFLFFALLYFMDTFIKGNVETPAMLCAIMIFILAAYNRKMFDLSTAGFFCLSFGLLARRKFRLYYILFPLATLNRETTFLLIIFFSIYYWNRMPIKEYLFGVLYQSIVYVSIKIILSVIFANNGGVDFESYTMVLLTTYLTSPLSLLVLIFFLPLLYLANKGWYGSPEFIKIAFLSIFPLQIALHIALGYPFEIRVLVESFSILFLLAYSGFVRLLTPLRMPSAVLPKSQEE